GLSADMAAYEREMDAQRERARAASRFGVDLRGGPDLGTTTDFCGYDHTEGQLRIAALLKNGIPVEALAPGDEGEVVLERTPFYAESGGQVGDTGELLKHAAPVVGDAGERAAGGSRFAVSDTRKRGSAFAHIGRLSGGALKVGDAVDARIDAPR